MLPSFAFFVEADLDRPVVPSDTVNGASHWQTARHAAAFHRGRAHRAVAGVG